MGERAGSESSRREAGSGEDGTIRQPELLRRRPTPETVSVCQIIPSLGLGGAEQVAVRLANRTAPGFDQSICYLGVDEALVPDVPHLDGPLVGPLAERVLGLDESLTSGLSGSDHVGVTSASPPRTRNSARPRFADYPF